MHRPSWQTFLFSPRHICNRFPLLSLSGASWLNVSRRGHHMTACVRLAYYEREASMCDCGPRAGQIQLRCARINIMLYHQPRHKPVKPSAETAATNTPPQGRYQGGGFGRFTCSLFCASRVKAGGGWMATCGGFAGQPCGFEPWWVQPQRRKSKVELSGVCQNLSIHWLR